MRSYTGFLSKYSDHRFDPAGAMYLYQDVEIGGKRFRALRVPQQLNTFLLQATPARPVTVHVLNNLVGGVTAQSGDTYVLREGNPRAMLFVALALVGAAVAMGRSGGLLLLLPAALFFWLAWAIWVFKRLPNAKKL